MFRQFKTSLVPRIGKGLLRKPLTYGVLGDYGRYIYARDKRSLGIWFDFTAGKLRDAFRRKRPVVWGSAFLPYELFYGLDVIQFHPETLAALAARVGLSRHALSCAEAGCYSSDACSFHRCAMGLTLEGLLPRPDMVVSSNYLCDGSVKFFHNVSQYYGCEHYLLDVPYHDSENARKYLAGQLEELAVSIAGRQQKRVDFGRLAEAMRLSNEARQYMLKVNELRRHVPCPLGGDDALSYIFDMQLFGFGSKEGVEFFRTLYNEVREKAENGNGAVDREKFRLLWLHQIRAYYPNTMISHLEERGASVCFGESSHVHWEPLDADSPFESLAAKMLAQPGGGPLERRSELALELAERYSVDGAIHFSHWGCRQSNGGEYVIRDILQQKGIPVLILSGDGVDRRNYSEEQTRLRLDAFLEVLEARK